MNNDQFLDENYEAPSSGGYSKIEQGENRFRILSSPLMLWVVWSDGKSQRIRYNKDQKPAMPTGENPSVKHAWAMVVWNYKTEQIEVMELDKMTLITPLLTHVRSADWGNPKHYDVKFIKSGSGAQGTKYALTAVPPKPVDPSILEALAETPVDLTQLLVEGGKPFLSSSAPSAPAAPAAQGNPFPPQSPTKAF